MQCRLISMQIHYGLTIRPLRLSDAKHYFDLVEKNRDHLSQFEDETSIKYPTLGSVEHSFIYPGNPEKRRYGIFNHNVLMGTVNLTPIDGDKVEIGYWLGKEFTREGIMTKVVKRITKYALDDLGYKTVVACVQQGNFDSSAVLLRAGYKNVNGKHRKEGTTDITFECVFKGNRKPHYAGCRSFSND